MALHHLHRPHDEAVGIQEALRMGERSAIGELPQHRRLALSAGVHGGEGGVPFLGPVRQKEAEPLDQLVEDEDVPLFLAGHGEVA